MSAKEAIVDSARENLRMALLQLEADDVKEAERLVEKALRDWPTYPHGWMMKALLLRRQNRSFAAEAKKAAVFAAKEPGASYPMEFRKQFAKECGAPDGLPIEPYVLATLEVDPSELLSSRWSADHQRTILRDLGPRYPRLFEELVKDSRSSADIIAALEVVQTNGTSSWSDSDRKRIATLVVERSLRHIVGDSMEKFSSWSPKGESRFAPADRDFGLREGEGVVRQCYGHSSSRTIPSAHQHLNDSSWYDETSGQDSRSNERLERELTAALDTSIARHRSALANITETRKKHLDPFLQSIRSLSPGAEEPLLKVFDTLASRKEATLAAEQAEYERDLRSGIAQVQQKARSSAQVSSFMGVILVGVVGACIVGIWMAFSH